MAAAAASASMSVIAETLRLRQQRVDRRRDCNEDVTAQHRKATAAEIARST